MCLIKLLTVIVIVCRTTPSLIPRRLKIDDVKGTRVSGRVWCLLRIDGENFRLIPPAVVSERLAHELPLRFPNGRPIAPAGRFRGGGNFQHSRGDLLVVVEVMALTVNHEDISIFSNDHLRLAPVKRQQLPMPFSSGIVPIVTIAPGVQILARLRSVRRILPADHMHPAFRIYKLGRHVHQSPFHGDWRDDDTRSLQRYRPAGKRIASEHGYLIPGIVPPCPASVFAVGVAEIVIGAQLIIFTPAPRDMQPGIGSVAEHIRIRAPGTITLIFSRSGEKHAQHFPFTPVAAVLRQIPIAVSRRAQPIEELEFASGRTEKLGIRDPRNGPAYLQFVRRLSKIFRLPFHGVRPGGQPANGTTIVQRVLMMIIGEVDGTIAGTNPDDGDVVYVLMILDPVVRETDDTPVSIRKLSPRGAQYSPVAKIRGILPAQMCDDRFLLESLSVNANAPGTAREGVSKTIDHGIAQQV